MSQVPSFDEILNLRSVQVHVKDSLVLFQRRAVAYIAVSWPTSMPQSTS